MSTDAVDYLKFAAALIVVAQGEFRALHASGSPTAEAALARPRHVHAELTDAAGSFCPDGHSVDTWLGRYADGRPVVSAMPTGGACYAHAWHPDRTHPMNNRCDELDVITTPGYVLNEVWRLRPRALLARAHGDATAYAHFRDRYRDMAKTPGYEGHIAWAEAMP